MKPEFWRFTKASSVHRRKVECSHIASLGLPLENKRVLEPGCGIGLLSSFFEKRGCKVFSTDGRRGNIAELLRRYPHREGQVKIIDFDKPRSHNHLGEFDIVFAWDMLEYARDPSSTIADFAQVCTELFISSLTVCPTDNGLPNHRRASNKIHCSLHGVGCTPARDWMMTELKKNFRFVYVPRTHPNLTEYPKGRPEREPQKRGEAIRAIFIASRKQLKLPTLSDKLLTRWE